MYRGYVLVTKLVACRFEEALRLVYPVLEEAGCRHVARLVAQIVCGAHISIALCQQVRLAAERPHEISATIGPDLLDADWHRRRE